MGILEWFASLSQNSQDGMFVFGICVLAAIVTPIFIVLKNADKRWKLKYQLEREKFALEKQRIELEKQKVTLEGGRQKLLAEAIEVSRSGNHTPLALLAKNEERT